MVKRTSPLHQEEREEEMNQPVKCPVCEGRGHVHGGFYYPTPGMPSVSNVIQEMCRACQGVGIIWTKPNETGEIG